MGKVCLSQHRTDLPALVSRNVIFPSLFGVWSDVVLTLSKLVQQQIVVEKYSVIFFNVFSPLPTYQQNFT